ncbi:MAG: hypothetical protein ABIN36_08895, partial [Ferruginibacter sp.]
RDGGCGIGIRDNWMTDSEDLIIEYSILHPEINVKPGISASRIPHPASRIPHPASRIPYLESRIPHLESRISHPVSRITHHPSSITQLASSIQHLGSRIPPHPPSTIILPPYSRFPIPLRHSLKKHCLGE